ncbi:MAG: type II toxin-antitoxin system VapC family toxin [Alphaproteobacteria bacterium]|nr:type II toxin-antitoxin system VapC family toxin [Alphaproteobacteria bacterium]
MSYLLDTNVLSELRKAGRCDPAVAAWASARAPRELFTSVLVIGEIRKGIELRRRVDAAQANVLERWLAAVARTFQGRILPVDQAIAEDWGRFNVPDPLPPIDGLLAATARVHGMTLVTRDIAIIEASGVRVFDPFTRA